MHGRILTTVTFTPLHRCNPASHSLMVWLAAVASSPTRTHTFIPGLEQSAESLQRHSWVWSERTLKGQMRWRQAATAAHSDGRFVASDCPYRRRSPTCDSWCSLLCCAPASCMCCPRLACSSSSYTAVHAFCTQSEGRILYDWQWWHTHPKMSWGQKSY